ncbi:polysaccharide biosynthesis protein [Clostridium sp. MSTE9]|uniref:lipopolysaccharide biosynthesis protein n=1 Tax=Clostridium sp. (strain MSTE9) TaxID=1105031 RepID=UPI00026F2CD6|nr:oligosaccharide flippase family protein [Clostridium sp. MSTE9]EJF39998.1 polysaccharide biosynthesis protein [Clostridium sp. MSTE9]
MSFVASKIKSLRKNQFFKNVAVLSSGTAAAQLIPIAAMYILGRLYGPELQGVYGIYVSITGITQQIACFRYDYAIVVVDSDEEAGGAFVLSASLSALFSAVIGLAMWPFISNVGAALKLTGGAEYTLWMVPLTTFICGLTNALNYFNVRFEKYKVISISNIIRVSVMVVAQIGLAFLGFGYWGLIIGQFLSFLFGNLRMLMTLKGRIHRSMFHLSFLKQVARKNMVYPKYMLPSAIANSFAMNMMGVFTQMNYGAVMNGYYSLINRILGQPLQLISNAVSQVFLQGASADKHNGKKLSKTFSTVTKWLIIISVFPFGILLLWGEPIISRFLGEQWRPMAEYLRYLIPLFMVRFVVMPLTNTAIALGRQKATMVWQFFLLAVVLIPSLLTMVIPMTYAQYLLAASLPMAAAYLIFYRFCQKIVKSIA